MRTSYKYIICKSLTQIVDWLLHNEFLLKAAPTTNVFYLDLQFSPHLITLRYALFAHMWLIYVHRLTWLHDLFSVLSTVD
jgi:hypothetical protein